MSGERRTPSRLNQLARCVVDLHQKYCTAFHVRAAWVLMLTTMILQIVMVALARP